MSLNKFLTLALCISITGCAQTPQSDADGGHWWSQGSDKVADAKPVTSPDAKPAAKVASAPAPAAPAATPAPVAKPQDTGSSWWPFSSKGDTAKAPTPAPTPAVDSKLMAPIVATSAGAAAAKADSESKWWWPFSDQPKAVTKADIKDVPMPDPKITQAWLDDYEPRLRSAIQDKHLQVERRENVLVVVVPVDDTFNSKRPAMLLPSSLGSFSRIAKLVEGDTKTSVLVLGHGDSSGVASATQVLSKERATSVASIFSLSGMKRDRLMLRGMGDLMPRAANDSVQGRTLNRRMEIVLTQRTTMLALLSKYSSPTPPVAEMVAVQDVKPAAVAPAGKKAAPAKKTTIAKKAAAPKKAAPAKKATAQAKKPVVAKATPVAKPASGQ
ncbi:Outer membrane protein OmpA [Pseudomonas sp. ok272]|uniref:OmpA family protein n=1 Tax=unclassified Pseudomonas TaxID=196821 RepID=UPI0008D026DE|nr:MULTISPECIES: OmpA family protein [unclassified Pseudomonas]SEM35970.1 Outer membrane protein OmpA [Pseudomonas sp. ok272]SFM36312.1 Outer membrane protein OmpA [Pseudomonas sp. ok602]